MLYRPETKKECQTEMVFLLVDDEIAPLKELSMAVNQAMPEAEAHPFQWSRDALAYAEKHPVDAAFLDVTMPEMDGIELAGRLKALHPRINIIFCTGYSSYMPQAFSLHASGYLMKPVSVEAVREEMACLRFDASDHNGARPATGRRFRVMTFGDFTLFADGMPVSFTRSKAKEILAYLVDRKGGTVSRKELAAAIFEDAPYDRNLQNYLSKIIRALQESLEAVGASELLIVGPNQYAVNTDLFDCDLYDFCNGVEQSKMAYFGEYMNQYSWAEMTQIWLDDMLDKE